MELQRCANWCLSSLLAGITLAGMLGIDSPEIQPS